MRYRVLLSGARVGAAIGSTLILSACQTTKQVSDAVCAGAFSVQTEKTEGSTELFGYNGCHVPMFAELSFPELRNLASSRPLPVQEAFSPRSRRLLLSLEPIDRYKSSSYALSIRFFFGNSAPRPDPDYLYAFPFGGSQPRPLFQGVGGELTHHGLHRYSFDFGTPIGTPVLAARRGIVLSVKDGFPEGGFEERYRARSNSVIVLHTDGTLGLYGHLSAGVQVKEGAYVEAGDRLGLSGNSGYSQGPHLHFEVDTQRRDGEPESVPIRFRGGVVPTEGQTYGPYPGVD